MGKIIAFQGKVAGAVTTKHGTSFGLEGRLEGITYLLEKFAPVFNGQYVVGKGTEATHDELKRTESVAVAEMNVYQSKRASRNPRKTLHRYVTE
jgi:hypothetical protein